MSRIFYKLSGYFFRRSQKLPISYRIIRCVSGASLFSIAISGTHLVLPFGKENVNTGQVLSVGSEVEYPKQVNDTNCLIFLERTCATFS